MQTSMFRRIFTSSLKAAKKYSSKYSTNSKSSNTIRSFGFISPRLLTSACLLYGAVGFLLANKKLDARSFSTALCEGSEDKDKFSATALYPEIEPYQKGTLKVSDVHTIAYALYGNPNGKPVLFVHGGPGGGTDPAMARYFDPLAYNIILVDQRGCGDSVPFADLTDNTTYDSVRDFEKLRTLLKVTKWQVFGGSWGSTLALAYAVEHPERVTELVLRGIFLLRKIELDWLYQGPGANFMYPEDWAPYHNEIPPAERGDFIAAYGRRLRGELGEEGKMVTLDLSPHCDTLLCTELKIYQYALLLFM